MYLQLRCPTRCQLHRSQSANAPGKSKLIKTGDAYEFSLIPPTVILQQNRGSECESRS